MPNTEPDAHSEVTDIKVRKRPRPDRMLNFSKRFVDG